MKRLLGLFATVLIAGCASKSITIDSEERMPAHTKGTGDINSSSVYSLFGPPSKIACSLIKDNSRTVAECSLGDFKEKTSNAISRSGKITTCEIKMPQQNIYVGIELINRDIIRISSNINGEILNERFEKNEAQSWSIVPHSKQLSSGFTLGCAEIISANTK